MRFYKYTVIALAVFSFSSCENKQSDRYVDFNGKKQHILDLGKGEPTVVFITGMNGPLELFDSVQTEISKLTRTLSYDRSGLGKSDILDSVRTIDRVTEELNRILETENFKEPYILVAHSYGGAIARYFLHVHPEKVKGVVLVDCANDEIFFDSLIQSGQYTKEQLYAVDSTASKGEQFEMQYVSSIDSALRPVKFETSVPVHLLISTKVFGSEKFIRTKLNVYHQFNKYAPQMKYIYTDKSGHNIQREEPWLVIESIKEVMTQVTQP